MKYIALMVMKYQIGPQIYCFNFVERGKVSLLWLWIDLRSCGIYHGLYIVSLVGLREFRLNQWDSAAAMLTRGNRMWCD